MRPKAPELKTPRERSMSALDQAACRSGSIFGAGELNPEDHGIPRPRGPSKDRKSVGGGLREPAAVSDEASAPAPTFLLHLPTAG
jgi:hypothetical protein